MMLDLVIKDGLVVDGTGNPGFRSDVGLKGKKVVCVSRTPLQGERQINAQGLVVAPGFIDPHSHSDGTLLVHSRAETSIRQGITTAAVGNCGLSPAPLVDWYWPRVEGRLSNASGEPVKVDWSTFGEWLERLERRGVGINVVPFVGHNTIRSCVMGVERGQRPEEKEGGRRRVPTPEELEEMKWLVRQAMEEGAFGLTTGLEYPPGRNAFTEELVALCQIVAECGGVHLSHPRSMGDVVAEATREVIDISERAGLPGNVAHLKAMGPENWGTQVEGALVLIEEARQRDLEITCDVYPYSYSAISNLSAHLLGPLFTRMEGWTQARLEALLEGLRDEERFAEVCEEVLARSRREIEDNRKRMEEDREQGSVTPNVWSYGGYPFLVIVYSPSFPELTGKSLAQIGGLWAMDPLQAAREILLADEGLTRVSGAPMSEEDVRRVLAHPASMMSTDGLALDRFPSPLAGLPHPRSIGTYPRVLERYVRHEGLLTLEEAIRKMTSLPAQLLGLRDRGLVREGMCADLVLFDPHRVEEGATYADPCHHPRGLEYVLVNGKVAVEKEQPTGALAGEVLRHG
jgi:N-acyl-D-amino-acid deacylase